MTEKNKAQKPNGSGFESLPLPTPWPGANARLLGIGAGLPVNPLDRLAHFSAQAFERFTLEWAHGYLTKVLPSVDQIQQRGGAGDKGRDIVVWLDPPSANPRRWHLYQCKRYSSRLGATDAAVEIAKVLYNTFIGSYPSPLEYWLVTHLGVIPALPQSHQTHRAIFTPALSPYAVFLDAKRDFSYSEQASLAEGVF